MRVVLDTNVLASGAITSTGTLASILDAWADGVFDLVISHELLAELARTLEKPYFSSRLPEQHRAGFLRSIHASSTVTPLLIHTTGVATHPEDDLILATAVSGQADYLVTGDSKLQALGAYQEVVILSPRDFLDAITVDEPNERAF